MTTKTARVTGSVARTGTEFGQEVVELGGRWVARTYDGTGQTLNISWGDDVTGEVGNGGTEVAGDVISWLVGLVDR